MEMTKLNYKILISFIALILISNVATAQKDSPQKSPTTTQPINPSLSKSETLTIIKEELKKYKSEKEDEIDDQIEEEIHRSFGITITLIQFLLGVLTALPIFVGIGLFTLRSSIQKQVVDEALKNAIKKAIDESRQKFINEHEQTLSKGIQEIVSSAENEKNNVTQKLNEIESSAENKKRNVIQ